MTLHQKLQVIIIGLAAAVVYMEFSTAQSKLNEPTGTVISEAEILRSSAPSDRGASTDMEFKPLVASEADALKYFAVYKSASGLIFNRPPSSMIMNNLMHDYGFSDAETVQAIAESKCGLRAMQYVSQKDLLPNDREIVRLFWGCDNTCSAIVSETNTPGKRVLTGRAITIALPIELCEKTWGRIGVPLSVEGK